MIEIDEEKLRRCLKELGRYWTNDRKFDAARDLFQICGEHLDLSVALCREQRYEEAIEEAKKAVEKDPLKAYIQLSDLYGELGDCEKMSWYIEQGLKIDPESCQLRRNRAHVLIGKRDPAGREDLFYTSWHKALYKTLPEDREFRGQGIRGKVLFVLSDEGSGDMVQYYRFLPLIDKVYGPSKIVVQTRRELHALCRSNWPQFTWTTPDMVGEVKTNFWTSSGVLGSFELPYDTEPYIAYEEERAAHFLPLFPKTDELRVALTWGGNPAHSQDHNRSVPFEEFKELLAVPNVQFYALQFGEQAVENHREIPDLAKYCSHYADTAAMLAHIDLVVSVDTSIVHLAGAMGTPCWVVCKNPIDARWGFPEEKNDLYGCVRQFRNPDFTDISKALHEHANVGTLVRE